MQFQALKAAAKPNHNHGIISMEPTSNAIHYAEMRYAQCERQTMPINPNLPYVILQTS
jgi:hypothetical protein